MSNELALARTEFATEVVDTKTAVEYLRDKFHILTPEDFETAGQLCKDAKIRHKVIDEKRKTLTAPFRAGIDGLNAFFREILDPLAETESILKAKMGAYSVAQEAQRIEAARLSEAQFKAGGIPTAIIPEPAKANGVAVRMVWCFDIETPELVPQQFCSPDYTKIQAARDWSAYSAEYPPPPIPGVKFYQKPSVAIRTK